MPIKGRIRSVSCLPHITCKKYREKTWAWWISSRHYVPRFPIDPQNPPKNWEELIGLMLEIISACFETKNVFNHAIQNVRQHWHYKPDQPNTKTFSLSLGTFNQSHNTVIKKQKSSSALGHVALINTASCVFPAKAPGQESFYMSDPSLTMLRRDLSCPVAFMASRTTTWTCGWWSVAHHLHNWSVFDCVEF